MLHKQTRRLMKFVCNQMMYSYKFYFSLRDQSLEKWVKYIKKILIINKRFYLFTEIFRRQTKIETFNRLRTKLLNFNRQLTSGPPHSDPRYLVPLHKHKRLLWRYLFIYLSQFNGSTCKYKEKGMEA